MWRRFLIIVVSKSISLRAFVVFKPSLTIQTSWPSGKSDVANEQPQIKAMRRKQRATTMAVDSPVVLTLLFLTVVGLLSARPLHALGTNDEIGGIGRRVLLSFKETPRGSNVTFDCSPSGPCVPCQYSEKNEEKYRCSETGYRIPLKCVEIKDPSKDANGKSSRKRSALEIFPKNVKLHTVMHSLEELASSLKHRRLLSDSSTQRSGEQAYITYRSCIPAVNEDKLSVLGFEGIVLCMLLVSGFVVYVRKKRTAATFGFGTGWVQANSRF